MRKNVLAASVVSGLLAWSSAVAALPSGCWEPSVKARLDKVIAQNQGNSDAYAVFDFDYTTAIGDLSLSCVWEMLETLDFREGDFRSHVRIGLPERFRREAEALADLADKLGVPCGAGMSRTPAWGAFARGYWKLFWSIRDTCGDPALCRWRMGLFAGYEPAEMRRFAVRATTRALAFGGVVAARGRNIRLHRQRFLPRVSARRHGRRFRIGRAAGVRVWRDVPLGRKGALPSERRGGGRDGRPQAGVHSCAYRAAASWCGSGVDGRRLDGRLHDADRFQRIAGRPCFSARPGPAKDGRLDRLRPDVGRQGDRAGTR